MAADQQRHAVDKAMSVVTQFQQVFHARASLPYERRTQWELLDELLMKGWQLETTKPKTKVKAITSNKDVDVVVSIVFEKNASNCHRNYLLALTMNMMLALRGLLI